MTRTTFVNLRHDRHIMAIARALTAAAFVVCQAGLHADELLFSANAYYFRGNIGPEIEVVVTVPTTKLLFEKEGASYVANYHPEIVLFDADGEEVKRLGGDRQAVLDKLEDTKDPYLVIDDIARFNVDPGRYQAVLELAVEDGRSAKQRFAITVPKVTRGELALSDVMIVRAVDPEPSIPQPERFQKLGHTVLPSPTSTVRQGDPVRWYAELYEIGLSPHRVRFDVIDTFGNRVITEVRDFGPYRDRARFLEGLSLRNIPAGAYTLRVTAEAGNQKVVAERSFRQDGPEAGISKYFTAERQKHLRTILEAEGDTQALQSYDGLEGTARAHFAYGYWREHDPLLAVAYVGPLTGLGRHEVRLPLLRALKHERTLKKRVDKTFGERLPEPDTLRIRLARERLDLILEEDREEPLALTGDALLALEAGYLAEGEFFAKRALKAIPDLADAKNAIGLSKIGRSDWKEASEWFDTAAASDSGWGTPRLNGDLARFLSGKGNAVDELEAIRKAVYHDLTHPDAYYIAGRLLERHGRLEESAAAYRRQFKVNPQHARARFDLGRVLFKQERFSSASSVWSELMASRPDFRPVAVGPALDAFIRSGETGKAQALIADELRTLDDAARARVEDIELVASPSEMVAYENLPEEDRPKFIRAFWQKRDPTPVSPGNERLVEHYRRVVYALHNFSSKKRGWDRRGDVYIRYGEPAHISRHNNVVYETDPKVIRVRERLLRALSSEAREEIIARAGRYRTSTRNKKIVGEYGQQVEYQDFESIDFEMNPNRSFFIGEQDNSTAYVRGTEEATHRGRMREKPIHGIPLFPVDGGTAWEYWIYTDVAGGIEVVFTALTPKGEFDYPVLPRGRELARFNEKFWEERRSERVITRAKSKQPDRYLPVGDILDFHFAAADFRGRGDRTRLEVYYGVPVRDLAGLNNDNADASGNIFERGIAVFDSTWTPTYRNLVPMAFTTQETEVEAGTLAIDEVALQLRPGRYYLGVQVNHPASNRRNGYTQEWVVDDYRLGGLGLSDIEVAGQIEPDTTISDKGGLKVLPMPSRTFKVGQPVLIYYEVYGLAKDEFGQTRHRVDYRIKPRKGKLSGVRVLRALGRLLGIEEKAIVTISYERSGTDADEQNYLEIDPGDSKEGVYELTVTVTDLMSEQTNEKSTTFLIGK